MAPYEYVYQAPNFEENQDHLQHSNHVVFPDKKKIVNGIQEIVQDFAKTITTTFATPDDTSDDKNFDFNSINSAENAIYGLQETNDGSTDTIFSQETTTSICDEITTETSQVTDIITTSTESYINEIFYSQHNHTEDSVSPNMPYIILVVILAVLVVITIVALVVYQKRKSSNSKEVTGVTVIGKTFNKTESQEKQETQMPQEILYGDN